MSRPRSRLGSSLPTTIALHRRKQQTVPFWSVWADTRNKHRRDYGCSGFEPCIRVSERWPRFFAGQPTYRLARHQRLHAGNRSHPYAEPEAHLAVQRLLQIQRPHAQHRWDGPHSGRQQYTVVEHVHGVLIGKGHRVNTSNRFAVSVIGGAIALLLISPTASAQKGPAPRLELSPGTVPAATASTATLNCRSFRALPGWTRHTSNKGWRPFGQRPRRRLKSCLIGSSGRLRPRK